MRIFNVRTKPIRVLVFFFFCILFLSAPNLYAEEWKATATEWKDLKNGWEKRWIGIGIKYITSITWISDDKILIENQSVEQLFVVDIEFQSIKKSAPKPKGNYCSPYCDTQNDFHQLYFPDKKNIKLYSGKIIDVIPFKKLFPKRPDHNFVLAYGSDGFVFTDPHDRKMYLIGYDNRQKKEIMDFGGSHAFCYEINDGEDRNGFFKPEVSKKGIIAVINNCDPEAIILIRKKIN